MLPIAPPGRGPVLAHISHNGGSNFVVESPDLLVNTIGGYDGTVLLSASASNLQITADGDWHIELKELTAVRHFNPDASGHGDDVLYFDGSGPLRFAHDGQANFVVEQPGRLLVNEIGPYNGVVLVDHGIVQITADGNWTVGPR